MSSNIKKMAPLVIVAIFLIALDRFLKILALALPGQEVRILGEYFKFTLEKNQNIAFSLPLPNTLILILTGAIMIALISLLIWNFRGKRFMEAGLLTIIVFGGISNMLDRLVYGYVIDYLSLKYYSVFNLADFLIVIGVLLIGINEYQRSRRQEKWNEPHL